MSAHPLGRATRLLRRLAGGGPADPASVTPEERLSRWAARIAQFGIVDQEFFEAQVGRPFASELDAIRFYLENGRSRGLSLSPLIEPEWMAQHQPDGSLSWFDTLHREDPALFQTGPLFDAAIYAASLPAPNRPVTTLDALRHFLTTADDSTLLPTPTDRRGTRPPAWSEARREAIARAENFAGSQRRTRRRHRPEWNGSEPETVLDLHPAGAHRRDAQRPLVSVILPVFRRPDTIESAIESVQAQTYGNWELIVVDDGSDDATAEHVERLAAADARITLLRRPHEGAGSARNAGLRAANGDVVAFIDADNAWRSRHLDVALAVLLDDDAPSSVHDGVRMVGANNESEASADQVSYRGEDGTLADLLAGNFIDLNALVTRREVVDAVGPFDSRLRRWIDWEWILRIARAFGVPRYIPALGVDYDNHFDGRRVSSSQPESWHDVALAPHLIDWPELERTLPERADDLVSVVMPVYREWALTRRAIETVLDAADEDGDDVEVIVIDNGSPRPVTAILSAWFGGDGRVVVHREDRNRNFALGSDVGIRLSRGSSIVMLNNDTEVGAGWLAPLCAALEDPGVLGAQPLLLYPDTTVQTAGTVFGGDKTLPWHFLAGHHIEDAARALSSPEGRRFRAITAAAAMYRAGDLVRWRGFDPIFTNGLEDVDLCLRAVEEATRNGSPDASFVVVPESRVVHHESRTPGRNDARIANRRAFDERWAGRYPASDAGVHYAAADLDYRGVAPGEPRGHGLMVRSSAPVVVLPASGRAPGTYRWAIKSDGTRADDVAALADGLRRGGHTVLVDAPDSYYRPSSGLDDVTVRVGDDAQWVPQPGAVNVAWGDDAPAADFAVLISDSGDIHARGSDAEPVAEVLRLVLREGRTQVI